MDFPDEAIFTMDIANGWKLYFDGSHTRHSSGAGIMFVTPQGDVIPKSFHIAFNYTNNIAEYEALITGLKLAIQWNIQHLQVYGDSQLVIRQVNDDYDTKDEKLMAYKQMTDFLKDKFVTISFNQLPRIHNKQADAMATIASMIDMPQNLERCEFLVEKLLLPAFELSQLKFMCELVGPNSPWYQDIYDYLHAQILPPDLSKNERWAFIRQATRYIIIGDTLYKWAFDQTLLRCLDLNEANTALHEVHEGICGGHFNGLSLAKKLMRTGYYWPRMEQDAH